MDKSKTEYRTGMMRELNDILSALGDGMLEKVLAYARIAYENEER
jgi:hypothetical protein